VRHRRSLLQRRLLPRRIVRRGVQPVIPPGVTLDERYRIVRLLGEGAMGAVYEAEHVIIGRRVALKLLHARFTRSPEAVSRFTREARAAAAIGHPHIVNVTDFGTHGQQPFLVMELLRGETLGERMARLGTVPSEEACFIMGQVLSALDAAHAIGVVHRDLKPENVYVGDDRAALVKLLDFGVSKFHPPGACDQHITRDGLPIGTPHYMAPEQWTGQRDVDARADLFAAGVMFFELLTGGLPYEGADTRELFDEVVHGTQPPPAPSEIAPGVPASLDDVVLKAVSRDRAARFQTAQEFLDALRPFGADADLHRAAVPALSPDVTQRAPSRAPVVVASTLTDLVEARATAPIVRPVRPSLATAAVALFTLFVGVAVGAMMVRPTTSPTRAPASRPALATAPVTASATAPASEAAPHADSTPAAAAPASNAAPPRAHARTRRPRRRGISMSHEF
jgi:eukaryotic-like serine/threonine-protein kinase